MKLSRTFIAPILFSFGVGALQAQTPTTPSQPQDCGPFVQQFYDWYAAKENALMKSNSLESALEVSLREKRSSFSAELVKGLKEDLAASKKSPDEVGLDFDPFLNAQDIAERYFVGCRGQRNPDARASGRFAALFTLCSLSRIALAAEDIESVTFSATGQAY